MTAGTRLYLYVSLSIVAALVLVPLVPPAPDEAPPVVVPPLVPPVISSGFVVPASEHAKISGTMSAALMTENDTARFMDIGLWI